MVRATTRGFDGRNSLESTKSRLHRYKAALQADHRLGWPGYSKLGQEPACSGSENDLSEVLRAQREQKFCMLKLNLANQVHGDIDPANPIPSFYERYEMTHP